MVEIKPQVCNELPQELTPCFKTSYCYMAVLIKILSNLIAFLSFKTSKKIVKFISIQARRGLILWGRRAYN